MKYLKYVVLLTITFMYTSIVSAGWGGDIQQNISYIPSWISWNSVSMEDSTGAISPIYSNSVNINNNTFVFVTRENNKSIVYQKGDIIGKYDAVDNLSFNEDDKLFFRAKLGNKQFMVVDNKKEKEYDGIGGIQLKYGTGKTDYSYSYVGIKNNKYYLVYNGIESKGYEYINQFPYFNKDNYSKIVYTVKDKNGFFLIVNGKSIIKRYKDLQQVWDMLVNGNFLNIAILDSGEYTLLVNGITEIGKYSGISSNITFSPDGKDFFILATLDSGEYILLVNGITEIGKYYWISYITFSPDGKDYYYFFQKENGGKYYVLFNGKELNDSYDDINIYNSGYSYNSSGKLFFLSVSNEGKSYYVVNGKAENKYDRVNNFTYSDDDKNYIYFGLNGETWIPVVNGNEIK